MAFPTRTARTAASGRTGAAATLDRHSAELGRRPDAQPPGLTVLGRYRLHKPLGAGGFGTVWMARDERLDRDVAVKVLARERIIDGRFEREARAAARLSHPGIVTLYEAAVDDDGAYLVSELVRGTTLSHLLEAGRLSDRDILEIGVGLCDALDHAHAQGVVHRDVKPSNVLIPEPPSPGAVAKLTDFGVARLLGSDTLTRTGDVIGTAGYMAPEQADGREAGAAADLYSLALVLYEALTGVNPISLGAPAQRARRLGAHLPPLRRQRRDLPGDLGYSLDLALRPRARERGRMADLREGLLASLDQVTDEPGIIAPAWPRPSRRAEPFAERPQPFSEGVPPEWAAPADAQDIPAPPRVRWPARVMGGAAAGLSAAWMVSLPTGTVPAAPAAVALIAAGLVAALPGLGWLLVVAAGAGWLAAAGYPGAALIAALAALVPVVVLPRHRASWPLAAAAPALGVVALAGLWPVLAGRRPGAWQRAGLGAVGWVWTVAAGLLAGRALYLDPPRSSSAGWLTSLNQAGEHVLPRLLSAGVLAPAAVWALAALLVPWLRRGSASGRMLLTVLWAAGLGAGTALMLQLGDGGFRLRAGALMIGVVAAWIAVVAPALIGRRAARGGSSDSATGLA